MKQKEDRETERKRQEARTIEGKEGKETNRGEE